MLLTSLVFLNIRAKSSFQRIVRAKKTSVPSLETFVQDSQNDSDIILQRNKSLQSRRKMSDPDIHHSVSGVLSNLVRICQFENTILNMTFLQF